MTLTKQQKEILKKQLAEKQVQLQLFCALGGGLTFTGVFIILSFGSFGLLFGILLFSLGIIGSVAAQQSKDFIDKIRFQLAGK